MKTMTGNGDVQVRPPVAKRVLLILLVTASILMVPLVAMQFTNEVAWDGFDFVVAGVLLAGTGLMYEVVTRNVSNSRYRNIAVIALVLALVLVWMELAVGIFGSPFAGS